MLINNSEFVIANNLFFSTNLKYSLADNFDDLRYPPINTFPAQVRSDIKEYLKKRNESQPLWASTCGCIFKNAERPVSSKKLATCRAGEFIDIMGLKGFQMDQVRVSPLHANFMENRGGADHSSMVKAINFVKEELKLQFGIDFETEVKF